jgi:hypothetical protein
VILPTHALCGLGVPSNFYISSPAGFCKGEGFDGNKLPVDGAQVWPLAAKKLRLMGDSFR